jgi:AcrR family transcriptional regulator
MTERRRRTQAQRRAETRAALLEAATRVFAERGFHASSVEEVAAGAGVTTGALYGHFASKEELFLAVFEETVAPELAAYRTTFSRGEGLDEQAHGGAERFIQRLREDPTYFPLFIEFWSYGVRNPDLRPRFAARFGAFREAFADLVQAGAHDLGLDLDRQAAERLGTIINALGNGIALERTVDPDAVPDELLGFAYAVFFRALAQAAAEGSFNDLVRDRSPNR